MLQSIIFDKRYWTPNSASLWLFSHNIHPIKKMHETSKYYRFRLAPPQKNRRYVTKQIKNGIKIIILI